MQNAKRRLALWAQLWIALVASTPGFAAAPGSPISCQNAGPGLSGPCLSLKARNVLLAPTTDAFALLLNFGLAWPTGDGGKFELLCEEVYAKNSPGHALLLDNGTLFMPTLNGLRRTMFGDGCTFTHAAGIPNDAIVIQIVAEKHNPLRIWALATSSEPRRTLYLSVDGGLTFAPVHAFAPGVVFWNIAVFDSNPTRIVLGGSGQNGPFALATSLDGGSSFTMADPLPSFADAIQGATLLGVSPIDPDVLYFSRATATGPEELWRSRDGGTTAQRVLALQDGEALSGFTFGATANELFVAGHRLLETTGVPPAHLFASKDGGDTWDAPIASSQTGPRLRCLHYRKGTLWGCGGDASEGDKFLLGRSTDEGLSWSPVADVSTLSPIKACTAALCPATTDWLCNTHGLCASPTPPAPKSSSGCSVQPSARHLESAGGVFLMLITVALTRRRKR